MTFRALQRQSPKTKKTLHVHARKRAYERYGLVLTQAIAQEFVCAIQQGQTGSGTLATLVRVQSLTRSLFDVRYRGDMYRVAYNRKLRSLTTFLPKLEASA